MTESAAPTPRLLLIDTVDQLPGLLPWHAHEAVHTSDLILLGRSDHPLAGHLDMAEERYEVIPDDVGGDGSAAGGLGRTELLAGLSLADKARARWAIDRVKAVGSVAYVFGPDDTDAFTRTLGMEAAREQIEVEVVYFGLAPKGIKLLDLVAVQERLLAPGGCPWDAEQTHATLAKYVVEEAHELAEAIASGETAAIAEELGDVLMQVTFHAELAESFDIDAVATGITDKLVRRHPHVFADAAADTAADVETSWEAIKAEEKPERDGPFAGVPSGLPATTAAAKVQSRAERLGFAWPDPESAAEKVAEELGEVLDALTDTAPHDRADADEDPVTAEVGDLLFAAISLARAADVDPDDALRRAVARFRSRFEDLIATAGDVDLAALDPAEWQARWDAT